MVGTILSRVLSRTKIANLKSNKTHSQHEVDEHLENTKMTSKTTSITFDVNTTGKSMAKAIRSSSRKHSYASVKEDPELPQSFRTRRLLSYTDEHDSAVEDLITSTADFTDDESVLIDDSEDENALYTDSDDYSTISSTYSTITLSSMPDEILDTIFSYVTLDTSKDRYADPRVDLFSLLFVSKSIHAAALRVLYRHVKVPQSKAFFKLHNALLEDSQLGRLVQCLDFSHYSNMGYGRARSVTIEKPYLTPKTLKACLDCTTNLKAFLVHEHIDEELDHHVLTRLFNTSTLQALDLCGSSSKAFVTAFTSACAELPLMLPNLQRLSLHECGTLRPQVFEALLPRLARLTHLDVAHTMINDKALMSIPTTARITHLNLERCNQITGAAVVEFLTTHPAARDTMIYLNLLADASRYRLLAEDEVDELLPALPSTLRSLNIGGARINSKHTCVLRRLATQLEELGLKGADLSLSQDISHIMSLATGDAAEEVDHPEWRHSLRYLDLTDIKSVNQMSLTYSPTAITASTTTPLEVIEVGDAVLKDLSKRAKNVKSPEWVVREIGRRGWYVRQPQTPTETTQKIDDGFRSWKMGARWWGMRKIPVLDQETGGMYGYFMFKRA